VRQPARIGEVGDIGVKRIGILRRLRTLEEAAIGRPQKWSRTKSRAPPKNPAATGRRSAQSEWTRVRLAHHPQER